MNNEIKEILERIKTYPEKLYCLSEKEKRILLDYITNLQKTNKNHSKKLIELGDKITNLQQENEKLKKALNCKEYFSSTMPEDTEFVILTKNNYDRQQKDIQLELIDYKSRCEKAIEYINHAQNYGTMAQVMPHLKPYVNGDDLLNILQNGSDDNE